MYITSNQAIIWNNIAYIIDIIIINSLLLVFTILKFDVEQRYSITILILLLNTSYIEIHWAEHVISKMFSYLMCRMNILDYIE